MRTRRSVLAFIGTGLAGDVRASIRSHAIAATQAKEPAAMDPERHDPFPVASPYRGIYAHGVSTTGAARTLYISGQVGVRPDGALETSFEGQCRQAFRNLFSVLQSAEMTPRNLVKMTFFLTRKSDMVKLVDIRREFVDGVRPAVTTLFVKGLVSDDWFVEIEAVAATERGAS